MFGFNLFRGAGATGRVFTVSGGRFNDQGIGWSGLIGPTATVAVVPTVAQTINFTIDAITKDRQDVNISGSIQIHFDADKAKEAFDFTVNRLTGGYLGTWEGLLRQKIVDQLLTPMRKAALEFDINTIVTAQSLLVEQVEKTLTGGNVSLSQSGVVAEICSISSIDPADEEVAEAIGSTEREALLANSDVARHERRMKSVANDREVQTYESQTKLQLEADRAKLVDQQGKNQIASAKAEAEATKIKMAPLSEIESGKLLATSLVIAAKDGRVGSINLTTELLAAVNNGQKGG